MLDEIRMANPLSVGEREVVCWSKKLALRACEAVHLTAEKVAESCLEEVEAAKAEAVAWLEEHKPKAQSRVARERLGTGEGAGGTGHGGHDAEANGRGGTAESGGGKEGTESNGVGGGSLTTVAMASRSSGSARMIAKGCRSR
jgi:hypothetical protein